MGDGRELDTEELVAARDGLVECGRNEPFEQGAGVVGEDEPEELFGGDGGAAGAVLLHHRSQPGDCRLGVQQPAGGRFE